MFLQWSVDERRHSDCWDHGSSERNQRKRKRRRNERKNEKSARASAVRTDMFAKGVLAAALATTVATPSAAANLPASFCDAKVHTHLRPCESARVPEPRAPPLPPPVSPSPSAKLKGKVDLGNLAPSSGSTSTGLQPIWCSVGKRTQQRRIERKSLNQGSTAARTQTARDKGKACNGGCHCASAFISTHRLC